MTALAVAIPAALALFFRWVAARAEFGGVLVRWLDQVRRAIAYEEPPT